MSTSDKISIVTIGVHRTTAEGVQNLFDGTPYELVAILDTTESPKPYRYSPQNLGVTLHALVPRPRALVTGNAVGALLPEIEPVWEEYLNGTGVDGLWVAVSEWKRHQLYSALAN